MSEISGYIIGMVARELHPNELHSESVCCSCVSLAERVLTIAYYGELVSTLEKIQGIAYQNYGRQNEKMADIEPLARDILAKIRGETNE